MKKKVKGLMINLNYIDEHVYQIKKINIRYLPGCFIEYSVTETMKK